MCVRGQGSYKDKIQKPIDGEMVRGQRNLLLMLVIRGQSSEPIGRAKRDPTQKLSSDLYNCGVHLILHITCTHSISFWSPQMTNSHQRTEKNQKAILKYDVIQSSDGHFVAPRAKLNPAPLGEVTGYAASRSHSSIEVQQRHCFQIYSFLIAFASSDCGHWSMFPQENEHKA